MWQPSRLKEALPPKGRSRIAASSLGMAFCVLVLAWLNIGQAHADPATDLERAYQKSVVFVSVSFETADGVGCEAGTGFIISSSGYVVTSKHLITDKDGKVYDKYTIIGSVAEPFKCDKPLGLLRELLYIRSEPDQDTLLLKFSANDTFEYLHVCAQTTVDDGEELFSFGFELGQPLTGTKLTRGDTNGPHGRWIVEGAINPGSSGGPVFNKFGRLVGMIYGQYEPADGFAFMVPLDHFKDLFQYAAAPLETCTTPKGEFVIEQCATTRVDYPVSFDLAEHQFFVSGRPFEQVFAAKPNHVILNWNWRVDSSNSATEVEFVLNEDRNAITARAFLRSGPLYDQWRGWLSGVLSTDQQPTECKR